MLNYVSVVPTVIERKLPAVEEPAQETKVKIEPLEPVDTLENSASPLRDDGLEEDDVGNKLF